MFKSISKTVACTGELSALICIISRGKDFIPPPSRLFYLALYTLIQLSTLSFSTLSQYGTQYSMYWTLTMNDI